MKDQKGYEAAPACFTHATLHSKLDKFWRANEVAEIRSLAQQFRDFQGGTNFSCGLIQREKNVEEVNLPGRSTILDDLIKHQ